MNKAKPIWAILIFALACTAPYVAAPLERFRFVRHENFEHVLEAWNANPVNKMFPAPAPETIVAYVATKKTAPKSKPSIVVPEKFENIPDPPYVGIEGSPAYLGYFHVALQNTRDGSKASDPHGITRIVHIGDSPVCGDLITSEARARLQKEFGDGGPGWHLPSRPWEFYMHDRMTLNAGGWKANSQLLQSPGNKGDYGLAGIAFTSASPRAYSTLHGWRKNPPPFSRLEIHYQQRPAGGSFEVIVDGEQRDEISTAGEERAVKMRSIEVPDGPHEVTLRPKGNGEVTLFGVVMERDQPGVVYDSLGSLGASIHWMTLPNREEWIESLRLRRPHLVILGLGTNESGYGYLPIAQYEADYKKVIQTIREALPAVSILIMAPMDRGTRGANGEIVTMPKIPELVEAQRRVARDNDCAFFDTYEAMGGEGTMARWYHGKPRLVNGDYTHPTLTGANRVGDWLVRALLEGQ
jgi:lysophospholipase L1-like esterase